MLLKITWMYIVKITTKSGFFQIYEDSMQTTINKTHPVKKFVKTLFQILLILGLTLQSGCASLEKMYSSIFTSGKNRPETAESLVQKGLDDFNHANYYDALSTFEKIKDRYPFSQYSLLAELKTADSQYFLKNYPEALVLYEEFEERHPSNEAVPYVMFQMGMCYYQQIDTIDRDTSGASNAVQVFSRLVRTFQDSPYTDEAQARINSARNFLADHEFYVAQFYIKTKSYEEAAARLEELVSLYPETTIHPRAQRILTDLKAGNPPKRGLTYWLPGFSFSD